MATLEKIRSKAGLLIGVIAFALFAFIVGDFLKSPKGGNQSQRLIAKINGEKINIDDYQAKVNELTEVYKINTGKNSLDEATSDQVYTQVWDGLLRDYIMGEEYSELGLAVSKNELDDRILGKNTDPIIRQMFSDPNTGQFNKAMVINYLKNIMQEDGSPRKIHWLFYENVIKQNRLNTKYNNLIAKGLFVTPKEAALDLKGLTSKKSIEFFGKPYSSINDSLIKVSTGDIKKFYEKNIERFKQEESRKIEYISFPILASSEDYANAEKWMGESKNELEKLSAQNEVRNYVKLNSDNPWVENYMTKDEVETRYKEFAFDSAVGKVYGPYLDGDTYKMVKLVSREMRSDSVKASHILIGGDDVAAANALADSLFEVVKANPRSFAKVAEEYSTDQGSASQGGNLDWFKEGAMVKPFSDACFNGAKGDIVKVVSQFGIHIIQIVEKGKTIEKVQLASVTRKVEPSTDTYRQVYAQASKFLGTNNDYDKFEAGIAADKNIVKRIGANLKKNDKTVNNLTKARSLVKWAYGADVGQISDIIEVDDQFVIAALTQVSDQGYQPMSAVEPIIKAELIKDKKAMMIIAQINEKRSDSQTLSSLAQKMNESVKNADGIDFQAYQVNGAGVEPALVGAVSFAKKDVISEAVKGNNGVYVFKVVAEQAPENVPTAKQLAQTKTGSYQYRINYQAFAALKDNADIEDLRYKFY